MENNNLPASKEGTSQIEILDEHELLLVSRFRCMTSQQQQDLMRLCEVFWLQSERWRLMC